MFFAIALAACKGGDGGSAGACAQRCKYEAEAVREITRDLGEADRLATSIEQTQVKSDEDIKREAAAVAERCAAIDMAVTHALGVAWALDQERATVDGEKGAYASEIDAMQKTQKATTKCDRSPAQLKADVVPGVHALKNLAFTGQTARCEERCAKGATR